MEELARLVRRAQAGEGTAYDEIVRRFQDRAVGHAYSILGDWHTAEDAAQDAFLQAFRDLPTLHEAAAFPAWLRRLVFKHCDRRTRRRQVQTLPLEAAREAAWPGGDPARAAEEAERRDQIWDAIQSLPEHERSAVALFYIGGHSQAEIGAFLGIPVPTVKKRLERARQRLKVRMQMIENTLSSHAPSRDRRFSEAAALLRRITEGLEADNRVLAAWLVGSFGRGDDPWASAWVQAVVADEQIETFILGRRENAARPAEPLLVVEAPRNAPPGGAYLMALYDGEAGPYEVDWYWQARSGAQVPSDAHVLFDRVRLPPSGQPNHFNDSETPPALRAAQEAMTPEARRADEGRNTVSLFWAMLLISASHIARGPAGGDVPFLPMLQDLLRDTRQFVGLSREPSSAQTTPDVRLAVLREIGAQMEVVMPQVAEQGADVPTAIVARAGRYLDMVKAAQDEDRR